MDAVEAMSAITALTSVALRAMEAAQRASILVAAAQAEGRDLRASEIAEIKAMRDQALSRWEAGTAL